MNGGRRAALWFTARPFATWLPAVAKLTMALNCGLTSAFNLMHPAALEPHAALTA